MKNATQKDTHTAGEFTDMAPELLTALEYAERMLEEHLKLGGAYVNERTAILKPIRDSILKATGKA